MSRDEAFEREVRERGERIFELAGKGTPSVFDRGWWSGKVMDWAMKDEAFKVEMFRFVDVFPTLRSAPELARHLQEYFCRPEQDFPAAMQWGLKAVSPGSVVARAAAAAVRKNLSGMARRFIVGATPEEALPTLRKMWDDGIACTIDLLGEATLSEDESLNYQRRYDELLDALAGEVPSWPERELLERSADGRVPRVNVSVKVSALYSQLDPADFDGSTAVLAGRLLPLLRKAKQHGALLNLDTESYKVKALTLAAFRRALEDPSLEGYTHAGIVCQAYLHDALGDLEDLLAWVKRRGVPVTVRLVKGAYWDYETVLAAQEGHACPVFTDKAATDACYERCTSFLLENRRWLRPAFASHNVRSLAFAMKEAERLGVPQDSVELQMLYGMAEPLKAAVKGLGYRVREYAPVGDLIPGMAYLVRRLLENTSNEGFLRASFVEGADRAALLAAPAPRPGSDRRAARPDPKRLTDEAAPEAFANEPLRDFTDAGERAAFGAAVAELGKRVEAGKAFKKGIPLFLGGKEVRTGATLDSVDPTRPSVVVASVCQAGPDEADEALEQARRALPGWMNTPPGARAALLFRTARAMRRRRDDLAALQVFEVGKTWREADADVAEAIDFLEYYGREMIRLGTPRRMGSAPGERNDLFYQAKGVGVVIAPWNFPLAILTGMTSAAVVCGNPVIVKPARSSSAIAWTMMECWREAGLPPGVIGFLPGPGSVVGAKLIRHPDVHFVAFTGSMEVGLDIIEAAARTPVEQAYVKRVVAEMGGKNAVIVDADADLDEAVAGVVRSAFGFQGQKCSACSRAVVLESGYEEFAARLRAATESLAIGSPADPATRVGPVVDAAQYETVRRWAAVAKEEGEVLVEREVPSEGWFVGPLVVTGIRPEHRIAQEEVFGPVLAVMKARDFDEALAIANGTRYALTGGLYSRSPANIERARREFRVGNLYINRPCTGALVERQPFGGFKMSGVGSKAGGPDYLLQFLDPRTVTENTMRRGFSPEV